MWRRGVFLHPRARVNSGTTLVGIRKAASPLKLMAFCGVPMAVATYFINTAACDSKDSKDEDNITSQILLALSKFIRKPEDDEDDDNNDPTEKLIAYLTPIVSRFGFGGCMGYCAGMVLKKVGESAAYAVGAGFIILQTMSYMGYISIDYNKAKSHATKLIDMNGDGKITARDVIFVWRELKKVLTYNLPGAGGFSAGFALGVYYG